MKLNRAFKSVAATLMLLALTASAVADVITIGTGTSAQRRPFGMYWGYERDAAIYTAAEIGVTGTITNLGWYVSTSQTSSAPVTIYMATTSASTLTADTWANTISGATTVYSATTSFPTTGWQTLTLSTPFVYSGSNLVVLIETNYGGGGTSSYPYFYYTSGTSGQHEYWYADDNPPTGTGYLDALRPNIQLTIATAPMSYVSSTTTQNTAPVVRGVADQWIIGIQVVTAGTLSPFNVTQFDLSTNGTTSISDISNAKIYYTGTSSIFAATNQFGSTVASPPVGAFTITGNRTLTGGTNYFWLTYDIPSGATVGNFVDAECTSIAVWDTARTPSPTAPAGNREIKAPLTGIKTIGSGGNYATFTAAINELNAVGPGSGGVTFNVTGTTFTENPPAITATGTSSNPIVFRNANPLDANPIITPAAAGTLTAASLGANGDAVVKIVGGDYITFDGIDIQDYAGANQTEKFEYGYMIAKASGTDGSKNVTIKNCAITLDKTNTQCTGVYICNLSGSGTAVTVTTTDGRHENIKVFGNTISNVYHGINATGFAAASPYTLYDQNIEIGVDGPNSISNFGGGASVVYAIYTTNQNNLKISNNMISGGTGSTTTLYGIYAGTGYYSNLDIHKNSLTLTNASTQYAIYNYYMGYLGTGNTVKIDSNTVSGCSTTGSTAYWYGIYNYYGGATNVNIFGNNIFNNSAAYYMYLMYVYSYSAPTNENVYDNNIYNNTTSAAYTVYGIYTYYSSTTNLSLYRNNIYGNSSAGGTFYGLYVYYASTAAIYQNNIYNNSTSGTGAVYGVYVSSSATTVGIYKNNVYDLTTTGTGAVYGIYSYGTTTGIFNNFISGLTAPAGTTTTTAVTGIYVAGGTSVGLYYNSIYLDGTGGTTFGSSGIYASTTPGLEMRNNIVVNVSTPGATGGWVTAYRRSSATLTTYASTSNNNCLYVNTGAGVCRYFYSDGTNTDSAFAAYQARVSPRDAASVTENPAFQNVGTPPYDLHIPNGTTSQCESGGSPVTSPYAITDDYDGNTRNATYPDIGADEFAGIVSDLTPPAIVHTQVTSGPTTNFTTSATITDPSGVAGGTNKPRLYYKKAADGTYAVDSNPTIGGSSYTWTFNWALVGGGAVAAGDSIYYYLAAQDVPVNVGTLPLGGSGSNPPGTTPPPTQYRFMVRAGISGSFTVGTGGNYASLTEAMDTLNRRFITGPVTLSILNSLSVIETETFPITISGNPGLSATNTLTIKPAPTVTATISGSSTSSIIKLNGADWVIIDGSNVVGGTSRDLTITNTSTSSSTAAIWLASLGTGLGATNNTIKNCIISCGANTSGIYGLFVGGAIGSSGDDNDNVTIQNNVISKAYYGIYAVASATGLNDNLTIDKNLIGSGTTADQIGYYGIYVTYGTGGTILQNTVYNIIGTVTTPVGIYVGTGFVSATVSRNNLNNIVYTGTAGYGGRGIYANTGSATSNTTIVNNIIYKVGGDGYTTFSGSSPVGMYFDGSSGGFNIYFNSVYMSGDLTYNALTLTAAILFNSSSITNINLRDNAFQNSMNNTANTGAKNYAIYSSAPASSFTQINFNDYYVSGTQGVLGYLSTDKTDSTAWRGATLQDVNSRFYDPQFNATTDLIPLPTSPLLGFGVTIPGITVDYAGITRGSPPSIGAYETSVDLSGPTITYTALGNTTSTSNLSFTNVTITDASGVNTNPGNKPRVYYKKSTNANTWVDNTSGSDGWKYEEANGSSSPFDFTINYGRLYPSGTVTAGDVVQYFVVAEDLAPTPNVGIKFGTFAAQPSSVALTSAAFPVSSTLSYNIAISYSGSYNVGTGQTYTSLSSVGGFFQAINNGVVVGNVTLNIVSNLADTGAVALNQWAEEGGSGFTMTIQPSGGARTISGTANTAVITLNGADRVTIDGRISGSGNNLTITNTKTTSTIAGIWVKSLGAGAGCNNVTIRNCNVSCGANISGIYGIFVGGATIGTTGADNDNVTLQMNNISKAYVGIWAQGTTTTNPGLMDNIQIIGNTIGSEMSASYIGHDGIMVAYGTGGTISQNAIYNIITSATTPVGITVSTGFVSSMITRNVINNIAYTSTGGYGGRGMYVNTANASSNNAFVNNAIYVIGGDGYSSFSNSSPVGMYFDGTSGGFNIYYNSIYMSGNLTYSAATLTAGILFYSSTITSVSLRDNAIQNSMNNTVSSTAKNYAIYSAAAASAFTSINYNDYWVTGTQGVLGYLGGDKTTLTAWQTATGKDTSSISQDPLFNSTTNLRPGATSPLLLAGVNIDGIGTDLLGVARNATQPTIGAYEQGGEFAPPTITYTPLGHTTSTSSRTLTATITDASGVQTGTNGPRLYFKKSTDPSYTIDSSPTVVGDDYTFTINLSVTGGDVVQYYVAAQDVNGNVATNPSGGSGASPPGTTPPPTPNSYIIVGAPLTGDLTVGTTMFNRLTGKNLVPERRVRKVMREVPVETDAVSLENEKMDAADAKVIAAEAYEMKESVPRQTRLIEEEYWILTENGKPYEGPLSVSRAEAGDGAASLPDGIEANYATITAALTDLNLRGVSGHTRFLLLDNSYPTETYPLTINVTSASVPSASATVTIKPQTGVTTTISGATANGAVLDILNTSYVTIDGSNAVGGTTRNLKLSNTSTTYPRAITVNSPGLGSISNITLKNCTLVGYTSSSAVVIDTLGTFSNITIENNSIQNAYMGMYISGGYLADGANVSVLGNTLDSTNLPIVYVGVYLQGINGATVRGNTIGNFDKTGAQTDRGMWMALGTTNATVERNAIHDMGYTGTSGYNALGVNVTTTRTECNVVVKNNMIWNLTGDGYYYSTLNRNPIGILADYDQTGVSIYNNSIHLYGNTLNYSSSAISAGIALGSGTYADVRNNAIKNNLGLSSSTGYGATGVIVYTGATQFTNLDRNAYYVSPTGSGTKAIGMIYSTSYTTLGAWQSATGKDIGSVVENIPYTSNTDLHIPASTVTQLESWAVPLAAVTNDFDGDVRHATAPDVGADEFSGVAADFTPPAIVYTPLANTHLTTNRTLAPTISDLRSGVQRSVNGKPRLYIRKAYNGSWVSSTATESPFGTFTFTIDHSTIGTVSVGDTVYYYVAAQDSASPANVVTNPTGTSYTADPPNGTVASPNWYRITPSIAGGTYTIGTGGLFPTVKAAFDSINVCAVAGNIILELLSSTTETGSAVLNAVSYTAGGPYTIALRPSATQDGPELVTATITSAAAVTIDLNGADNVTIDGRAGGVGTSKDLTIENTSTSGIPLRFINGAGTNTVRYTNLKSVNTSTSTGTVLISTGSATDANSNNLIENCAITSGATAGAVGVYVTSSSTPVNTGNTVRRCDIYAFSAYGVYVGGGATNTVVDQSNIYQTSPSTATSIYGVYIASSAPNLAISKNKIYGLQSTSTTPTITGIYYFGASGVSMDVAIVNNFISLDATTTHLGATLCGVDYYGYVANSCYIYYNSVYIGGSGVTSGSTYAFRKRDALTTLNAKDNIWFNARSNSTGTGKHYAIYYSNTTATTLAMDYNDYYVSGTGGMLGYWSATDQATLAAWRTASGQDANSISGDPVFKSATDLHININLPSPVNNVGTQITGITDDIDGDLRNVSAPDIGADEFSPNIVTLGVGYLSGWSLQCNPVTRVAGTDSVRGVVPTNGIYPTSVNPYAFAYVVGTGYVQRYTMPNRPGFWVKFGSVPGTQNITGYYRPSDNIPVVNGWNLVGGISCTVDTGTITPVGLRASNWWGYGASGYFAATQIVPGKAYWIKANAVGSFAMSCPPLLAAKAQPEVTPVEDSFNSITITDANGSSQTLRFGADAKGETPVAMYEMPPPPPEGCLDARFETEQGGFMLQTHASAVSDPVEFPIALQASAFPLTITWKIAGAQATEPTLPTYAYELSDGLGGRAFGTQTMSGEGTMTIRNQAVTRFVLTVKNGEQLPTEYALYQNYPNPFNPTTNIKFALPVPSKITIEIYNILGQMLRTLVDEQRPAGYHVSEWNGTNDAGQFVGSGVYFVRLHADGGEGRTYSEVKKVMMLK